MAAFGGFDIMFSVLSILFPLVFLFVMGMFVFTLVANIRTWNKNNHSPRLAVPATVVTKRTEVSHFQHANAGDATGAHGYHTSTSTSYYVTFQVESGDRMELQVNGSEYGMLVEGDTGTVRFQGTRYLGFARN